ncbi:hypothetical protein ASC94_11220 [Massilia sp. Root418]|uniref:hypothetical protein n=1 Tax=Massilia sp. Root418 TaxID=1736532 RepID=UPI0006F7F1B6|nr:hypothetical protein [Massilia sp. Root418]KQW93234.1 hypothetical protein ASC94_11220 [Massilia sp. Root418]
MSAVTDKDYIDSRLETVSTRMLGEVRTIMAEMAGQQKAFEARTEAAIATIRELIDNKFAEQDAKQQRMNAELIKWVVGVMIAFGGLGITLGGLGLGYVTFLLNSSLQKPAATPIVIYAQPAAATPLQSPAPAPSAPQLR